MDTRFRQAALALTWFGLVVGTAEAQGTIAGAARDTSGAALPGVTVEATSPALIEKTRSVVTDGAGQYRIEILPPGTYAVTFMLPVQSQDIGGSSWTDRNGDFVPDCNLLATAANGECGAMADPNFGSASNPTAFDRGLTHGWGNRTYNWEFSGGVQHQLLDAVSVDVSYFRRSYGNLMVLDDRAVGPQDFDTFSITAPRDAALPDGGGYVVSGLYDLKPERFGTASQRVWAPTRNYGDQYEKWHGADVTFNVRPGGGVFLQGGLSTGRTTTDNCEVAAKVPESLTGEQLNEAQFVNNAFFQPLQFCHVETPYLTQVKFVGSYIVPRLDVQLSAAYQDMPGPEQAADLVATSAVIAPSLGRPLSGGVANQTINIVRPGTKYGERLHQLDLRVGKIFRFGRTRTNVGVDIFNALNTDAVLTYNRAFGVAWPRPTSILLARFAKISAQIDL